MLVLDDEGNELILPKQEQIPTDFFKKGDSIKAVVIRVEMRNSILTLSYRELLRYSWKDYLKTKYLKFSTV